MRPGTRQMRWWAALLLCGPLLWAAADWRIPPAAQAAERPAAPAGAVKARELRVLTSFYPMHIMALNVLKGIPGVTVEMLAPAATGCLHDYALTPEAMRRLEKADLLIANGLGMESYLAGLTRKYPRLAIVELSRGITPLRDAAGPNPHLWVSPAKAGLQVTNLYQLLAKADPARQRAYEENGRAYLGRIATLAREMHRRLDRYRGAPIVTFHEAFPYFAEEFGLEVAGIVEPAAGSAPNPRELADTIAVIRKLKVRALFSEPQYPSAAAGIIARETGLRVHRLDPAVTGPVTADAYLAAMGRNLTSLEEALR